MSDIFPQFKGLEPRVWTGRYKRIAGDSTAFHIRKDWPVIKWKKDGSVGICEMVECGAARELLRAVKNGKRHFGYNCGGSFLINEYGQILVPSPRGDGRQVLVGEWTGPLEFENPFSDGQTFDLLDDRHLGPGDWWNRPYVGIAYNLSSWDEIYFWDKVEGKKLVPQRQDKRLIRRLRSIRGWGSIRFVVLPKGIVITKAQDRWLDLGNGIWTAKYVGRIDFECWFPKEE